MVSLPSGSYSRYFLKPSAARAKAPVDSELDPPPGDAPWDIP